MRASRIDRVALSGAVILAIATLGCPPERPPRASEPSALARPRPERAKAPTSPPKRMPVSETQYLLIQIFTGTSDPKYPGKGDGVLSPPPRELLQQMAQDVVTRIGSTGNARSKLGFALGPMAIDHTDAETVQLIRDGFAIAMELDLAVAFHLDDSMFWGRREDLWKDPANIEWRDWDGTPNTGRRIDWGPKPTRLKPQMCFNSPAVQTMIRERAALIGREVAKGLAELKAAGKQNLFAGVMTGWETQLGRDFKSGDYLGYCGLANKGWSDAKRPPDVDAERVKLVREFMELWARELGNAGVPRDRIYGHIVFTVQGLDDEKRVAKASYAESVHFSTPDVAFSPLYRPGFSTYPGPGTFVSIYEELAKHGNPPWASAEGTNIIPNGAPGEGGMETYLGRTFNHGGVIVNIFSWGIGGDAEKNNMFRKVTENAEAIGAYRKFLAGEPLVENPPTPISLPQFRAKVERIQRDLPPWVQRTRDQEAAESLMKELDANVRAGKLYEANEVADEVLELIDSK